MKIASLVAALTLVCAGWANADPISYGFSGSSSSGQTAEASFSFTDANTLVLTLTNTSNIVDIADILDDFHFLLSATPDSAVLTSVSAAGGAETCVTNSDQSVTCTNDPTTDQTGTWGFTETGAQFDLVSNATPLNGQDKIHPYGVVNDSFITNAALDGLTNPQHNPTLLGPLTLDFTFTGFTTTPTVSNVVFSFGTTPDLVPGTPCDTCVIPPQEIPEPGILSLLGLGLLGLGWTALRRRS